MKLDYCYILTCNFFVARTVTTTQCIKSSNL